MNTEQQINLKFLVRFEENSYWSSQVVSRSLWRFKSGRPSTSRTSKNIQTV